MNQATNVNIVPSYGQRGDLHFSQYDVGRTATINLYAVNEAYTIPLGATVKIQATKPSGLGFDVACTFSGSVVTVVSTETMTAEAGRFPAELHIIDNSDVIGTANFMFCVEASPHPDGVIDGDAEEVVNEIKALVLQSEGYALGTQDGVPVDSSSPYWHNNSKYYSENVSLSDDVKQALLDCFENVAWIGNDGQDYYDALYDALYPPKSLVSIAAVYTQSGTVYDTATLDSLKTDLVVTATYDDSSTETVTTYTLSGSLTVGTSTITVTYEDKTATFDVTVTSSGIIYSLAQTTFTGSSDPITTDVQPLANNAACTFVCKYQGASNLGSSNWRLFQAWQDTGAEGLLVYVYSQKYTIRVASIRTNLYLYSDHDPHTLIITHDLNENGITYYSDSTTGSTMASTSMASNELLKIGQSYKGTMELTVYNRVLSSSEIAEIMGS